LSISRRSPDVGRAGRVNLSVRNPLEPGHKEIDKHARAVKVKTLTVFFHWRKIEMPADRFEEMPEVDLIEEFRELDSEIAADAEMKSFTDWELDFFESIIALTIPLTPKQRAVVVKILREYEQ
jgi:hypothetical protein